MSEEADALAALLALDRLAEFDRLYWSVGPAGDGVCCRICDDFGRNVEGRADGRPSVSLPAAVLEAVRQWREGY